MFRKPKRKAKSTLRRKPSDDEDEEAKDHTVVSAADGEGSSDEEDSSTLLSHARKRSKPNSSSRGLQQGGGKSGGDEAPSASTELMQTYKANTSTTSNADLATRTADHHAVSKKKDGTAVGHGEDGIFRDKQRNAFLAGPIRAAQHVRVTARFDYQPDICKDYKDTGFCGFGDTCIYLHDRGDSMSGWQLEQQWQEQKKQEKARQEREMQDFLDGKSGSATGVDGSTTTATTDDGLPFACHICRDAFKEPVVTSCGHYFCEKCIMQHVREQDDTCPICGKDTASVFNHPTKLISKKKRTVGAKATWEEYYAQAVKSKTT